MWLNTQLKRILKHKEITGASIFVISSFVQRGLSLITTPIYSRLLSTYDYGIVSTFNTWSGVLSVLFTLSIAANAFNSGLVRFKTDRNGFVSSMIGMTATLVSIGFFLVTLFKESVVSLSGISYKYFVILFIEMYCNVIYAFWGLCCRFDQKYIKFVVINLSISIVSIVFTIICLSNISYDQAFVKIVVSAIVTCSYAFYLTIRYLLKDSRLFIKEYWGYAFAFCLPLIPHYMSNHLLNQSDRLMITSLCGADYTGIYTIAYKLPEILNVCWSCVAGVYVPWLYKMLDMVVENDDTISRHIKKMNTLIISFTSVITIIIILFGPEIIKVLSPKEYWEGQSIVPMLVVGYLGLFISLVCSHIELFYKKNVFITVITVISAGLNILLNLIFIPKYGYQAAAYTTYIGYCVMLLLHIYNIKRLGYKSFLNTRLLLVVFFIASLFAIAITQLYSYSVIRYALLLVVSLVVLFNYKRIMSLYFKLKENG